MKLYWVRGDFGPWTCWAMVIRTSGGPDAAKRIACDHHNITYEGDERGEVFQVTELSQDGEVEILEMVTHHG